MTSHQAELIPSDDKGQQITTRLFDYLTACQTSPQGVAIPHSSLMDMVFESLDVSYPHKWRSAYPTIDDRDLWAMVWAERFAFERIDNERIKLALQQVGKIQTGFVPTLDEFVRASRPIIDYAAAHAFASRQWRRRHILGGTDNWDSHNVPNVSARAMFAAAVELQQSMTDQREYFQVKQQWMLALDEALASPNLSPIPPVVRKPRALTISPAARAEAEKIIQGSPSPTIPDPTEGELVLMLSTVRQLWRNLRRAFVDIAHDDPLLKKWVSDGKADLIYRRAQCAATNPNSRLMRFTWYTPEQMGLTRNSSQH